MLIVHVCTVHFIILRYFPDHLLIYRYFSKLILGINFHFSRRKENIREIELSCHSFYIAFHLNTSLLFNRI